MGSSEWVKFFLGVFIILALTITALIVIANLNQANKERGGVLENITIDIGEDSFSKAGRVHWAYMPLTYSINSSCGDFESLRIKAALEQVSIASERTVTFQEMSEEVDIEITCSYINKCYDEYTKVICPHETSRVKVTRANENLIVRATIEFIGLNGFAESSGRALSGFAVGECGHLNKEMHAVLRALGFASNNDPTSIMYSFEEFSPGSDSYNTTECKTKEIDASVKSSLSSTYQIN